ncbi:unnamed protein product [Closterium sp. Yama58-4]|nr:unnamed protein product [Closterium sp. Yama58-4]
MVHYDPSPFSPSYPPNPPPPLPCSLSSMSPVVHVQSDQSSVLTRRNPPYSPPPFPRSLSSLSPVVHAQRVKRHWSDSASILAGSTVVITVASVLLSFARPRVHPSLPSSTSVPFVAPASVRSLLLPPASPAPPPRSSPAAPPPRSSPTSPHAPPFFFLPRFLFPPFLPSPLPPLPPFFPLPPSPFRPRQSPGVRPSHATVAAAAFDPASTSSEGGSSKKSTGGSSRGLMKPYSGRVPSYAPKTISYKSGPVMSQPLEVYLIWHGTWPTAQKTPVQKFVDSISNTTLANKPGSVSDWWNINRLYKAGATYVTSTVSRSNTEIDIAAASSASGQTPLTKADLLALINFQILSGSLPRISSAVYVIFTSADVDVDGFGSEFCAFHSVSGSIKWAWVGMPEKVSGRCV